MIYDYPTVIVDAFFKYPLDVRELAMGMKYVTSDIGTYSGKRTESLHINHTNFFRSVCNKIMDCYSISCLDYSATMHFHITGGEFGNSGWVHTDAGRDGGSLLASIVYLNLDNNNIVNGTSIFKLNNLDHGHDTISAMKKSFINAVDDKEAKKKHNLDYTPTVNVGNMFNRMVAYDARNPHAGSGYYGQDNNTSRLTLLTFFESIKTLDGLTTLQRTNRYSDI
jgi:hypothetical protein